ncbi:hypothetical protein DFH08DRAFT_986336 [Mycena albidolilacea]|uniref:Uncharacterized protein n=1 Tax=Mycena albidolilacea TaxID=1033008 RepID=A0AAD6Z1C9_9AGAR|nr:hypothetical protein DFH08DRAFT_986336 [Mycena albidolilacea]
MLIVIFTASLLTTLIFIVHAVILLAGPRRSPEGLESTALLVANLGMLVTAAYRFLHKSESDDLDALPYTYTYSVDGAGVDPSNASVAMDSTESWDQKKPTRVWS